MKKTAFIGPLPPPLGGVAMINQSFQNLNFNGYDITVFNTSNNSLSEDLYRGFPWGNIGKEISKIKRLSDFLNSTKPDVVNIFITSGYSIIRDLFYLRMLYRKNIPIVIHFHSKTKGEFALTPNRLKLLSKFFNKYAKKIILLSEHHYSFFVKYFGSKKCEVIENFVSYEHFNNEIVNKTNDFLYVGRLSKEKGFFDLLKAVKILKDNKVVCRIQVIGVAPTIEVEKRINDIISANHLEDYFVFNGATFGESKYTLFKQSSCLIFPSHLENSPVVLKEAIAAKLAIIASDIDANQLILKAEKNHYLHQVTCPDSLAVIIEKLLGDSDVMKAFCKASESIKDYDKSIAREKLLNLMDNLC
ncbi:glycosyltransferase family 4 protein [Winogradskyella bathintestinalis]|uniref:Glycosyltransferase n=1 Tax=Winogradskyella bathintestinalis TaxID=3035208 RepID=A0ABT7ZSR2_9FLAO|nr:glycosyltransferase [Winogradskyella bathintestinalis]MDN3492051.1 glycosyltransferase [Winogradskyella bathintestinalis]